MNCCFKHCDKPATVVMVEPHDKWVPVFGKAMQGHVCDQHAKYAEKAGCIKGGGRSDERERWKLTRQTDRAIDLEERMRERTDVPVLGSRATMSPPALALRLQVAEGQALAYKRLLKLEREHTAELRGAIDKLVEATGGLTVDFQRQGSFTIAVLVDPISERVFTGAACCNAEDTFSPEIGKAISLGRAMNSRAEYYSNAAFAR